MSVVLKLLFLFMEFSLIFSAYPTFEKCQLTDSECIKKAAQDSIVSFADGVPELNTDVLDTMNIKSIKFELAGLKLSMTNSTLTGLKGGAFDKIKFNMKKNHLDMKMIHHDLELKGKYVASGRLLILPISGDGILTINMKHVLLDATLPFEIVKNADGKDVLEMKSYKFKYDFKENVHFSMTNLFNGNKQLSDAMHSFMNDNWKAVTDEFARPIIDETFKIIFRSLKNFFIEQPLEDLTLN